MANPLPRNAPANIVSLRGSALSGAAMGAVLTYTVPSGRVSLIRGVVVGLTNLLPTVAIQLVAGATTYTLQSLAANQSFVVRLWLQAGEKIVVNVAAAIALSTLDAVITAEEYESY